jgi:hypothetical protein
VSFFEPPPPPPEPPEVHETPEWFGAPDNVLPGTFPLELLIVRTDTVAIQANTGRAYPNGLEFTLTMRRRELKPMRGHDHPMMRWHEPTTSGEIADDILRFGIELADGRKATVFDHFRMPDESPPAIVLRPGGGGGSGSGYDLRFWAWPLPPPGPLAFVVEWPSESIALTRTEIDSEPIRQAATRAIELWPGGEPGSPGPTTQISVMRATSEGV